MLMKGCLRECNYVVSGLGLRQCQGQGILHQNKRAVHARGTTATGKFCKISQQNSKLSNIAPVREVPKPYVPSRAPEHLEPLTRLE